jgi:hypothetical protein
LGLREYKHDIYVRYFVKGNIGAIWATRQGNRF